MTRKAGIALLIILSIIGSIFVYEYIPKPQSSELKHVICKINICSFIFNGHDMLMSLFIKGANFSLAYQPDYIFDGRGNYSVYITGQKGELINYILKLEIGSVILVGSSHIQ